MVQTHLKSCTHLSLRKSAARVLLYLLWVLGMTLSQHLHAGAIPWHLEAAGPETSPASIQSAAFSPGSSSVVVAVIDSGIIAEHPALNGVLLPGFDMVTARLNLRGARSTNFAPDPRDATCAQRLVSSSFRTHGTEVASLIAGNGYENMWGVNPNARIVPVRIFSTCGMSVDDMIDAIRWSAGLKVEGAPQNLHPAKVINISITGGATQCRPDLQKAIDAVRRNGTFVVAAAGNNFQKTLAEPANCEGVISVGALSAENKIENYSALDSRTSIYTAGGGPALRVSQPWSNNKLKVATAEPSMIGGERLTVADKGIGTSFAAPVVSGFLSLWLSFNPSLKPQDWDAHVDSFVREVPRLEKCSNCNPRGLVASDILIKLSK
jgi:serine protease